jgi:short-subunit dehydrogenase
VIELKSRLEDIISLEREIKEILKSNDIDIVVNCAGVGIFKPHEEISLSKIKELIDVNLAAPIVITNLLLRSLKKTKGYIINISSIEATRYSKFSALYTATKSGLRGFSLSLFEELRKADVKVCSINPDMSDTSFFDNLQFKPADGCSIDPNEIAKIVIDIIQTKSTITDITIRPQKLGIEKKIKG